MADQMPDNDPVGNQLRATFAAEHADIERRHLAQGAASTPARSLKWVRFAMAAAVVAIAGFVFIGTRSNDQAVELDVAAQTPDNETPDSQVPAGRTLVPLDESGQPIPTPSIPIPSGPGVMVPNQTSVNMCGDSFRSDAYVVDANPAGTVPVHAEPEASAEIGVTRMLLDGTAVEVTGGCTSAATSMGTFQWFEIRGAPGEPNEWIRSDYLAAQAQPEPPSDPARIPSDPARNECSEPVRLVPHLVWGVAVTDPDGGLIAHTAAGVNEPVTRILWFDEVVSPSRGCLLTPNGVRWYELGAQSGPFEWVNAQYLRAAEPACLRGEQFGTQSRNGLLIHTVVDGDTVRALAARYNIAFEELLAANPQLDPNVVIGGDPIWIPGVLAGPSLIVGPLDGWAVIDGDLVAFVPSIDPNNLDLAPSEFSERYRWYPADGIVVGAPCFQEEQPRGPICLSGDIQLLDLEQPEPVWTGTGPLTAWRTGRIITPSQAPGNTDLAEVSIVTDEDQRLTGLINPTSDDSVDGHCLLTGSDLLADQPCTRVAGGGRTAGLGTNEANRSWTAGDPASAADHVHDIRTESNDDCTRIVIEFGEGANQGESSAAALPALVVHQQLESVRVTADGWQLSSAFGDSDRIDYDGGIGLLTLTLNYEFAVELMHREMEPQVRFLNDPARVVIDLFPAEFPNPTSTGPFGERFVLRGPIQQDLSGQGIPVNTDIMVAGFGRPFEAAGLYRIWSVPNDVDAEAFLADPPEPLIEEFFPTSGWAEGWGSFFIDLPHLEPGAYLAVFGELPPTDEIGFYGTGQLFRIADAPAEEPGGWPEAVLLPNVQLPPE
ncbi:MAG: LysM peptidoglycan-binding domain-containing protein [Acidimicrobiales bacterium]